MHLTFREVHQEQARGFDQLTTLTSSDTSFYTPGSNRFAEKIIGIIRDSGISYQAFSQEDRTLIVLERQGSVALIQMDQNGGYVILGAGSWANEQHGQLKLQDGHISETSVGMFGCKLNRTITQKATPEGLEWVKGLLTGGLTDAEQICGLRLSMWESRPQLEEEPTPD